MSMDRKKYEAYFQDKGLSLSAASINMLMHRCKVYASFNDCDHEGISFDALVSLALNSILEFYTGTVKVGVFVADKVFMLPVDGWRLKTVSGVSSFVNDDLSCLNRICMSDMRGIVEAGTPYSLAELMFWPASKNFIELDSHLYEFTESQKQEFQLLMTELQVLV